MAADCLRQIQFNKDAEQFFETERVRGQLRSMMDIIIRTLELIADRYSTPRFSEDTACNATVALANELPRKII